MPAVQNADLGAPKIPKKRGPKPKPLSERKFRQKGPVSRIERSYTLRKKIEVIMWLERSRVLEGGPHRLREPGYVPTEGDYRKPTLSEAAVFFQIPKSTIANWHKAKEKLLEPKVPKEKPKKKKKKKKKKKGKANPAAAVAGSADNAETSNIEAPTTEAPATETPATNTTSTL